MFKVGDEVVVFCYGHPLQHNSRHSPNHPCRGKVLKVGKKLYHIESTGSPWKVLIDGSGRDTVLSVDDAKAAHRKNFEAPDEWRTKEFIDEVIERL